MVKNRKRVPVLIACFSLLFSVAAWAATDDTRYVKVTAFDVNIRGGAGTEQPVVGHADYGDSFSVIESQNGWYHVQLTGGQTGWIAASLVTEGTRFASSNPTIDTVEATEPGVNVRGGASTEYDVILSIAPGTTYPLLQTSGDWVEIRLPDERTGWVSKSYVKRSQAKAKDVAEAEQSEATVIADVLNVRAAAGADAQVLGTLKQGEIVKVVERSGEWTKIEYGPGNGYVNASFIRMKSEPTPQAQAPSDPATGAAATLTLGEAANLRSGPGTNFTLLETGAPGSVFPITGVSGSWYQVRLQNGKTAWVAGWLTKVSGDVSKVPEQKASLDSSLRGKTIVLDAGHGGFDVGAIGRTTGLYEKDATLALTRLLYNKLLTTGAHVVLTRPDDEFVSLADRVAISKKEQADVFVSLHYNTNPDPNLTGTTTYYYSENGEDHKLAELVEKDVVQSLGLPEIGVRYGDYYVLRENPQTAILIETSFLSNAGDEQMAKDPAREEKAAEGIFRALVTYLQGGGESKGQ